MQFKKVALLIILKSLGVNFPIIKAVGCRPTKPIAFIANASVLEEAKRILCNFTFSVIDESMSLKMAGRLLCSTNSDFVWVVCSGTRKGKELLDFIITAMELGSIGENDITALPLVISARKLHSKEPDRFFTIYIDGEFSNIQIPLEEIVPADSQVEVVLDKISGLKLDGKSQEEKALSAAACFAYPGLKRQGCGEDFEKLLELATELVEKDDDNQDTNNVGALFVSQLYDWQEQNDFHEVYALPEIEMSVEKRLEEVIFFDNKFLYMQGTLFKEISRPLLEVFSEDVLKGALVV